MACDVPCMSYMALYVISMHLVNSSSRSSASASTSSQHWKLNLSEGKVKPTSADGTTKDHGKQRTANADDNSHVGPSTDQDSYSVPSFNQCDELSGKDSIAFDAFYEERMMQIISSKSLSETEWIVVAPSIEDKNRDGRLTDKKRYPDKIEPKNSDNETKSSTNDRSKNQPIVLTCGKKVNSTVYDHLKGISQRHQHSNIPEPDVAVVFQHIGKSGKVDVNDLERKLRKQYAEVETSGTNQKDSLVDVYNLIGNFWRIKGNTQRSIECFRKALNVSPNNSTVLLNLARLLLNLQYVEDAMLLTLRSLRIYQDECDNMEAESSSWLHHFTLGQALRLLASRGSTDVPNAHHARLAASHFRQASALNPLFTPAAVHLQELIALGYTGNEVSTDYWLQEGYAGFYTVEKENSYTDSVNLPSMGQLAVFVGLSIAAALLSGVLLSLETGIPSGDRDECGELRSSSSYGQPQQRHFNRAMAMRSIKMGANRRAVYSRGRKNNGSSF